MNPFDRISESGRIIEISPGSVMDGRGMVRENIVHDGDRRKLICFDLDGTLLNDRKIIPENNIRAIEKLISLGHVVSIATGRLYKSARKVRQSLPYGVEIICSNGAVIEVKNRVVHVDRISPEEHALIYDLVREHGFHLTFDSLYAAYHTCFGNTIRFDYFMNHMVKSPIHIRNVHCRTREEYLKYSPYFVNGIVISNKNPKGLAELRERLESLNLFNIESSYHNNVEIIPKDSNKGEGARRLARYHGISKENIIAFGDAENDHKLLVSAGISVGMGNASDLIKKSVHIITDTNNDDGIPKALELIFNEKFL